MRLVYLLGVILSIISISACTYDVEETLFSTTTCDINNVTYQNNILPILQNSCFQCHDDASNSQGGGIGFGNYSDFKLYVDAGTIQCVINQNIDCSAMPKGAAKLSDCKISQIENWIADGANEN